MGLLFGSIQKKGYTPKHGCLDLGNMMINDEILVAHSNLVMDYSFDITVSAVICYIAIENGHRNSGFSH